MRRRPLQIVFALLILSAAIELFADFRQRAAVPEVADWKALADHVRTEWQPGDVIVSTNEWAEPLVRQYLGDHISLGMAGRSDMRGYARAWAVAVGQRASLPEAFAQHVLRAEEERSFGELSLKRYRLANGTTVVDLVETFEKANVFESQGGPLCSRRSSRPSGGGLGRGPVRPSTYWSCPNQREWIGRTTIEDLDYRPRRCIWQRALARSPTRVTFPAVTPGAHLIVHGGHYLRDERNLDSPPVSLNVYVNGAPAGQMTHRDGDGWKGFEVAIDSVEPVSVSFETVATAREQNFCWSATMMRTTR